MRRSERLPYHQIRTVCWGLVYTSTNSLADNRDGSLVIDYNSVCGAHLTTIDKMSDIREIGLIQDVCWIKLLKSRVQCFSGQSLFWTMCPLLDSWFGTCPSDAEHGSVHRKVVKVLTFCLNGDAFHHDEVTIYDVKAPRRVFACGWAWALVPGQHANHVRWLQVVTGPCWLIQVVPMSYA